MGNSLLSYLSHRDKNHPFKHEDLHEFGHCATPIPLTFDPYLSTYYYSIADSTPSCSSTAMLNVSLMDPLSGLGPWP